MTLQQTQAKYPLNSRVLYKQKHAATVVGYKRVNDPVLAESWEVVIKWDICDLPGQFMPTSPLFKKEEL